MATVEAKNKGIGAHVFRSHHSKQKGSNVLGASEAGTKLTVSRKNRRFRVVRRIRKRLRKNFNRKEVEDSDASQAETLNESDCDDSSILPLNSTDESDSKESEPTIESEAISDSTLENSKQSFGADHDTDTKQIRLQEMVEPVLMLNKRFTESDTKQLDPINEPEVISDSTTENRRHILEADYDIDTKQGRLQEMAELVPVVVEAFEEPCLPVVNVNSNLEESRDIKQGWLQNFFVCRSGGAFILHSL